MSWADWPTVILGIAWLACGMVFGYLIRKSHPENFMDAEDQQTCEWLEKKQGVKDAADRSDSTVA